MNSTTFLQWVIGIAVVIMLPTLSYMMARMRNRGQVEEKLDVLTASVSDLAKELKETRREMPTRDTITAEINKLHVEVMKHIIGGHAHNRKDDV